MEKYRKAFYEIEKALSTDHGVIILFGLRKTGKTTILKQLSEKAIILISYGTLKHKKLRILRIKPKIFNT